MPNAGRIFCVAFPFVATFAALILLLVATIGGKVGGNALRNVYLFEVDLREINIDRAILDGILEDLKARFDLPQSLSIDDLPKDLDLEKLPKDIDRKQFEDMIPDFDKLLDDLNVLDDLKTRFDLPDELHLKDLPKDLNLQNLPEDLNLEKLKDLIPNFDDLIEKVKIPKIDINISRRSLFRRQSTGNGSASQLGLDDFYKVNLWGTCSGPDRDNVTCTDAKWDWASSTLNQTWLDNVGASSGRNITLPDRIEDGLKLFAKSIKYMQIVFVVALVVLGLELFFGFFSGWSRIWSCLAYSVAGIASALALAAAVFATSVSAVMVGAIKASEKLYYIKADFNTTFLILVWLSVVLSIVAGTFWCFSVCCCAPKDRGSKRYDQKRYSQAYQPVVVVNNNSGQAPAYPHQSPDMKYEPYTQRV